MLICAVYINLFFSCHHCNGLKNRQKYDGRIIDCCKDDPELHLHCSYGDAKVNIQNRDEDEKSLMTAELINEVFDTQNSGIRIYASQIRMKKLQQEMNIFLQKLREYKKSPSAGLEKRLKVLLSRQSAFASFKRDYIKDNSEKYAKLLVFLQ